MVRSPVDQATDRLQAATSILTERATRRAKDLRMSRSEFFARGAARYLDELDAESVTHQIHEALGVAGTDTSSADAAAATFRS